MNSRPLIAVAAALGSLMPLIFDSALKGGVLLGAAAIAALALWRASAAARHLVWLVAVVALLVVPVLTVVLPQWRVLPGWAVSPLAAAAELPLPERPQSPPALVAPAPPLPAAPVPPAIEPSIEVAAPVTDIAMAAPVASTASLSASAEKPFNWRDWLPLAWVAGFVFLALRLLAAHLLLRRAARSCTALAAPPDGFIAAAFDVARRKLGIRQRVTLLLDGKRTIPVVWGVFRPRLVLPVEAREWSEEQLRSVLLHELAHIKRRDALVQWLTQIACALHWFNPLVWLAAWRLHAERERACDDLVLASGVRPSEYAEHLLHVATKLTAARWTAACGLAMARKSSLEGRLLAVLSEKLNRRGLTRALTAAALLLAAAVAIPIAMLRAADEKAEVRAGAELQPDTAAKLQWGEPVNGLRMALAWPPVFDDALLGKDPYFQLVVQNVSEKAVRFTAGDDAPNPRSMQYREGERIVQSLSDKDALKADWQLQPGECGVLRLFSKEERNKDGKTMSALIEGDLSKIGRYHAIALMEIAKAPAGAWTGKLVSGETRGSADVASAPKPKHKEARALYEIWQRHARTNGDIPGALIGELATGVRRFIHYNPTWETVPALNAILTRLDASRDWKSADAIALLDEVAAVKDSPLDMTLSDENDRVIAPGQPLPKELADKPWIWSKADASGLRIGWDLEPRGQPAQMTSKEENWISKLAPGTALRARLFIHNTGKQPVIVRVPTWHQGGVSAVNKDAEEIEVRGIDWTTLANLVTHRLAPGEYVVIRAPGVGFGKDAGRGPWAGPRVGWNLEAKPGDWVRLTHAPLPCDASHVGRREVDPIEDGPAWWTEFVKARLARGLTAPAEKSDAITLPAPADRALLLERACRDLFGTDPTAAEHTAFDAVNSRATLFIFAEKLAQRAGINTFDGTLTPPPAWFEIQKPDPAAAERPRVVLGPGEYPVSEKVTLKIVGRPDGERRVNDAELRFTTTDGQAPAPHKLTLPDGWGNWAAVCRPDEGFFYVLHQGTVRKIDFSNPAKVTDTPANDLPAEFRDEVKRQFDIHEVSAESQAELFDKPAPPADAPAQETKPEPGNEPSEDRGKKKTLSQKQVEDALRIAAASSKSEDDIERLRKMILQASAEKATGLQPLLNDEALRRGDDKRHSLTLALAAYDYSVSGNKAGLQYILDEMVAKSDDRADRDRAETAGWTLVWLDEWDLSHDALQKHFVGNLEEHASFWELREQLYPESYDRYIAKHYAANKVDAASLRGVWKGSNDDVSVEIRFGDTREWEVRRGAKTSRAVLRTHTDGANVWLRSAKLADDWIGTAWLKRDEAGALRLTLLPKPPEGVPGYPHSIEMALTREADAPATEKPRGAAAGIAPGDEEMVFIPRMGRDRPFPVLDTGDGVTLAIHEQVFHGADVMTTVRIRYTAADGTVTGHDVHVAMDAFANREQWAFLWVRGTKTFWHVNGKFDGKRLQLYRTDFADPLRIVTAYDHNYEGEPLDALGIPADVRAKFEQHFGVVSPKPVDKTGGLPEVAGEFLAAARAPGADGSVPLVPVMPAGAGRLWKVQFVSAATGETLASLRAKVISRTAEGTVTTYDTRIVSGGTFEKHLGDGQYAWVSVEDEKLTNAEEGERLFGNVPADVSAVEKHTNPAAPFIVKVKARVKTAAASGTAPKLPKLPDDAYAKPGVHCQKFREEDAKRPGGELMGAVLEPSKPESDKEPLVLGVRTASDAQWRIGSTAKVGLVVRNRTGGIGRNHSGSDVKFSYTGRLDNGLSVVAVDEAGNEHAADIAHFDGLLTFQQMLVPVAHVATIKEFTLRFDAEKRGVSEPYVAAFHLPPGKYKLRCIWNDARPDVAHEGEWSGELMNEKLEFTLTAAAPAGEAPRSGDAGQRRKVDWSKFPAYDKLTNPFDPAKAIALAAKPEKSDDDTRRLMFMILQAAVEKAPELRPLLKDEVLKKNDDKYHSIGLALSAYDYSVNGNKEALQFIFDELAKGPAGDAQAAVPLGFIDEWDLTMSAHEKHFARGADGAAGLAYGLFWEQRHYLFPENYARFQKERVAAAKLDAESLRGVWKGSKDGVSVELRLGDNQGWEVRQGDKLIKAGLTSYAWENGKAVSLMAPRASKGHVPCGQLWRGDDGRLQLSIWPDTSEKTAYPRVSGIVLEKQADTVAKGAQSTSGLAAPPVSADQIVKGPVQDPKDPAKTLPASDPRTRTTTFSGNVRLRLPTMALDADEVEVVLKEGAACQQNSEPPALSAFESVTAKGRVRAIFVNEKGDASAAGAGQFLYDGKMGLLTLKEWPEMRVGDKVVTSRTPEAQFKLSFGDIADPIVDIKDCELFTQDRKLTAEDMPRTTDKPVPPVNPTAASETDPERSIKTARIYEKKGNYAASAIYYSEVIKDPASPHRDEAQKSIARLVAADPTLKEKFGHLIVNKLEPGNEAQLDWGEAVNGLRGAVVVMHSAAAGGRQGIYLAVQNVSQAPLRFADTIKADELRKLYVSDSKGILFALTNGEATGTDVVLQPREVTYLSMMLKGDSTATPALIEGLRKDSLQTWKAVMEIKDAPEGAWKGKLMTAETRGAVSVNGPQPKDAKAQALFKVWQSSARLNGDIPGGLLNRLHDNVKEFIRNNTGDASGDPYAKKMAPLEARFDVAGDWKQTEVVKLLDDIATVTSIPMETTMEHIARNTLRPGQPLPAAYEKANWGEPLEGGLRMAYVLEPRAAEYHLGTEVKARILLHNSGKEPVAFITRSFDQPGHKARNADGQEFKMDSTFWTTLGRPQAYRLAPGEYCEVNTPGLGIGAQNKDRDDWANVRAGSWILCEAGDEVTFLPGGTLLTPQESETIDPDWWLNFITERLDREAPVPLDRKEREYLLYRVVRELFGTAPSTTEGDAFAADKSPDALKNLAVLLTKHAYGKQSHGMIHPGVTKFRVLPPDPDAAKRPRVATNPGWYSLSDSVKFSVTRRGIGARVVNEASIIFFQQGKDNVVHKVELPDGYNTWAAATKKGATELWISEKGLLRRFDFSAPPAIKETRYEADKTAVAPIPADVREAVRAALDAPDAPKQIHEPPPPADMPAAPAMEKPKKTGDAGAPTEPSANPPGIARMVQAPGRMSEAFAAHCLKVALSRQMAQWEPDDVIAWGKEEDGLRSGVVMERNAVRGTPLATWLLIRNVSGETKEFFTSPVPNRIEAQVRTADGKLLPLQKVLLSGVDPFYKIVLRPGETLEFEGVPVVFGLEKNTDGTTKTPQWPTCGFETDATKVFVSFPLNNVHAPATGEMEVEIAAARPEHAPASGNNGATPPAADDSYAPVGIINTELPEGDYVWCEEQNGLCVGVKLADRDWRIGGEVKVELWVCNAGWEDVKSQHTPRRDIGLRVKLRGAGGMEHDAAITQFRGRPAFTKHLLKAGHAFKAKEFTVQLSKPQKPTPDPWFDLPAGDYKFHCEVDIPGTSVTDAAGKIIIPADGEWNGTIKSGEVEVKLLRPE